MLVREGQVVVVVVVLLVLLAPNPCWSTCPTSVWVAGFLDGHTPLVDQGGVWLLLLLLLHSSTFLYSSESSDCSLAFPNVRAVWVAFAACAGGILVGVNERSKREPVESGRDGNAGGPGDVKMISIARVPIPDTASNKTKKKKKGDHSGCSREESTASRVRIARQGRSRKRRSRRSGEALMYLFWWLRMMMTKYETTCEL